MPAVEDGDRPPVGGEERRAAGSDGCPVAGFERSQALFAGADSAAPPAECD
ncbi:MAG: hypothetical protein ABSG43_29675 [Solirubrobacteraceae bacterium]